MAKRVNAHEDAAWEKLGRTVGVQVVIPKDSTDPLLKRASDILSRAMKRRQHEDGHPDGEQCDGGDHNDG